MTIDIGADNIGARGRVLVARRLAASQRAASHERYTIVYGDVAPLRVRWTDLERRAGGTVFQSYAWCSAWVEATRSLNLREMLHVVTVWEDDRLKFLWPLAVQRRGPFRVLVSVGEPATQYCDALVEHGAGREQWLELAWHRIRAIKGIDAFLLRGVRADAAVAALVEAKGGACLVRSGSAPFIDFHANPSAEFISHRSGRTRNALRRHLRKLSAQGAVEFEIIDSQTRRTAAMSQFLQLKHAWLSHKSRVSAGYAHPANDAFLQSVAAWRNCVIARIRVGADIVAVEAGVVQDSRYYSLMQSYNMRYAAHGPGQLLIWHVIEHATRLGIGLIDFLAPAYPHKRQWSNGEMPVRDYVIPMRSSGRLVLIYLKYARPRLKILLERTLKGLQMIRRTRDEPLRVER